MKKIFLLSSLVVFILLTITSCQKSQDIGVEKAKEIALQDAGVNEADTTRLKTSKDNENNTLVYDIDFDVNEKEYSYEIDGTNGEIISYEIDTNTANSSQANAVPDSTAQSSSADSTTQSSSSQSGQTANNSTAQTSITREQAIALALEKVPGATEADIKIELDFDDGRYVYEGDIIYQQVEYDFEINADTGEFIKWSEEHR
jgi:uncharacterized membrane protein YkoI